MQLLDDPTQQRIHPRVVRRSRRCSNLFRVVVHLGATSRGVGIAQLKNSDFDGNATAIENESVPAASTTITLTQRRRRLSKKSPVAPVR